MAPRATEADEDGVEGGLQPPLKKRQALASLPHSGTEVPRGLMKPALQKRLQLSSQLLVLAGAVGTS
jgi:hypothetical protein